MGDIVLSGGVRGNLVSLQQTAGLMEKTQNRLATGKKVNSALDAPNAYFTSQSLSARAQDLNNLMDGISQSIKVVEAADSAITSMTKLIDSARAKANAALQTTDRFVRIQAANDYNALIDQIESIARDAGYNGKNLLGGPGNDLTIYFNEDNTNTLRIRAINLTNVTEAIGLPRVTAGTPQSSSIALASGATPLTASSPLATADAVGGPASLTFSLGNPANAPLATIEVTPTMTVQEFVAAFNGKIDHARASFNETTGALVIEATTTISFTGGATGQAFDAASITVPTAQQSSWIENAGIEATSQQVAEALRNLRTEAASFGSNLVVLENREAFTRQFIATLNQGADQLVLADLNEEGANLLALQTRQQLSSTALSLASEADQAVLRLFG